ncbi:MAG: hypothetical protein OXI76_00175 [Gemmatimonadota bacterium]|nr:hypothetical protein [Gemmatimonadota bacterium]
MKVSYDGPVIRDGRMSAVDVGSALIGMADVVSATSRVLYGDDSRVTSVVEANFTKGSFEINFALEAAGLLGDSASITELLVLLFGAGHKGLFGLIKYIGGRKLKRIEAASPQDGHLSIQVEGDNNVIAIDSTLSKLYSDQDVREAVECTVRPLERDGVEVMKISDFKSSDANAPELPGVTVTQTEAKHFKAPTSSGNIIHESKSEVLLRVVSPNFQEGNKWRFAQGEVVFRRDTR